MKKIIYLFFSLVIFFNLIFVPDTFAFYSCEEKATDLVKIQSEIDGLNAQKTTLENWLTNLKNWVDIQVGKRANEKSAAKNLEGKGSARYKDEVAELQTQIDELQTKINEVQASYDELSKAECEEPCNLVFGGWTWTYSDSRSYNLSVPIVIASHCSWSARLVDGWEGLNEVNVGWIQLLTTSGIGSGNIYFSLSQVSQWTCFQGFIEVTASDGTKGVFSVLHSSRCGWQP